MPATFDVLITLDHPMDQVVDVLADPEFHLTARRSGPVRPDRVVAFERTDDSLVTAIHYQFVGDLNAAARKFVATERLSWTMQAVYDLTTGQVTGSVDVDDPEYAKMITAGSRGLLREDDGRTTLRTKGTITVHKVPLVGGVAEKWIAATFASQQRKFGHALAERLAQG